MKFDEGFYVVVNCMIFFNSCYDCVEIVVCQYYVSSFFGNLYKYSL